MNLPAEVMQFIVTTVLGFLHGLRAFPFIAGVADIAPLYSLSAHWKIHGGPTGDIFSHSDFRWQQQYPQGR